MSVFKNTIALHETGGTILTTDGDKHIVQEVTFGDPLKDHVKGLQEANHVIGHRVGTQNHLRHIAEVPVSVYNQSLREQWDKKRWRQWLNDPDNAPLRVTKGRV